MSTFYYDLSYAHDADARPAARAERAFDWLFDAATAVADDVDATAGIVVRLFLTGAGDGDLCTVFFFAETGEEDVADAGDFDAVFFVAFFALEEVGGDGGGDSEKEIFAALFFVFPPLVGGTGGGDSLGAEIIAGVISEVGGAPASKAAIKDMLICADVTKLGMIW